ncbi:MAG: DUF4407 domain-containing protein [Salinivirgaceae bacterium]|jgi:hypothetical protein|nr:DUF4407 domain-containing protein [Salinivirgaceae bacterium]
MHNKEPLKIAAMEFKPQENNERSLKGIYKIICWCSGARLYLLRKCPTDYNVFFGIGMIVFLTGVMASMSGSYAFYTVFQNIYLAIGFGVFWGILIFFFDWYLVASLRKENRIIKEILTASPRIILALFLAVVISRPLELKLFESEINGQIEKMSQLKYNDYQEIVGASYAEIDRLQAQNKKFEEVVDDLMLQRSMLFELIVEEAEGRSPTALAGKGSVYKEKKAEYDRINKIYDEEKARLYPRIESNNKRITQLTTKKESQLQTGNKTLKGATGFLARIEAYGALAKENEGIRYASWFILFMFICIETGPMFVKLISKRGAYDELLTFEEVKIMTNAQQEIVKIKEKAIRIIEIEKLKSKARLIEEVENSKDFARLMMEAQSEIGKERIKKWKETELKRIDDQLDDYRPTIEELIEEARIAMKPN